MIAAASIIHGIGPQKYARNIAQGLLFFSSIAFGPYFAARACASADVKPFCVFTSRFLNTSAIGALSRETAAEAAAAIHHTPFSSRTLRWRIQIPGELIFSSHK